MRPRRQDHRGRRRAIDISTVHVSSSDPLQARVEAAAGQKKAAAAARLPAWFDRDPERSPMDPTHGKSAVCDPRQRDTERVGRMGVRRRTVVHWQ